MTSTAYIAFGSNLGDRRANISQALALLSALSEGHMKVSSLWQSTALDMNEDAGEFLNGVVCLKTRLDPRELLAALHSIEQAVGRPRQHARNDSRTMDLDIVCIDDIVLEEPDLVIPHPRAGQRKFVLAPLAEIAPDLILPGESETVSELLIAAPDLEIFRHPGRN